jgi:hypothetical protein
MNVKLLAACVLLLQRGTLLVSDNYKLAYALQTLGDLGMVWRTPAGTYNCPMLRQRKTAVHQRPANLFISNFSNLFYNKFCDIYAVRVLERRRTSSQLYQIMLLTL